MARSFLGGEFAGGEVTGNPDYMFNLNAITVKQFNLGQLMFQANHKTTSEQKIWSLFISRPITVRDNFNCEFENGRSFVLKKCWEVQVEFVSL